MKQMLNRALVLAAIWHDGQFDKAGMPYLMHVMTVMHKLKTEDEELMCIAVLHDIIEDTELNEVDLREAGMSERVISAVKLLTKKKKNFDNAEYLAGILTNRDAMLVKLSDLRHNMDLRRLKGVSEKDLTRMNKYVVMYHTIEQKLKENNNECGKY